MQRMRIDPSTTAGWQSLVIDAELYSGYDFDEDLENYLVLTLDHFTAEDGLSSSIIALDFLKAMHVSGQLGGNLLRQVGDQCLLLSGLFPECALRKNVSLSYFVTVGQQSYELIANNTATVLDPDLFLNLSDNFVGLMDVLHTMRLMQSG